MSKISKLLFTPCDYQQTFSADLLIEGLAALSWLGETYSHGPEKSFYVGEDFFKYITFMGCSPAMRLEPEAEGDLNFCFIHINTPLETPQFRGHLERFVPRCPECRHGLGGWQVELSRWQADPQARFGCPTCGALLSAPELNWKEKAGIGRCFVEVYSVYPHEGVPTPAFLSHFKTFTGVEWKYFYEPG